jgi:UDP-GlcNAc:undecaprenyl-phosphate/decaprenyl-phosphate GlcNAc-1-phosphate transferase
VPGTGVFTAAAACGGVVLLAEPLTVGLLRRWQVLDVPGRRSSHVVPTPRGGGLPIAVGLLLAAGLTRYGASAAFAAAVSLLGALGLADDLRTLPVVHRLVLQAAGSTVAATLLLAHLHLSVPAAAAVVVVAAVWITGFVNVFNFMDGVNGISAAHAVIAGIAYACYGAWGQHHFLMYGGLAVAAGALMFLPWNAGRARVFLGDVGSYALGGALAVLAARAALRGVPLEAVLGPVALYLADTGWTLQRRIRAGEPWLQSHRTHVYQQWCDAGWSHQEVTLLTGALTVLLTLLGAVSLGHDLPLRLAADLAGAALLAGYLRSPAFFRRLGWYADLQLPRQAGRAPAWAHELEGNRS